MRTGRLSGLLLPIFSLRSRSDFGIGDFGALEGLFAWMAQARQRLLMVLPLLPTAPGDPSPYATRSAFGLNPLFIDLDALPEFHAAGGLSAMRSAELAQLAQAREAPQIRYELVFPLKAAALRRAFDRFEQDHWAPKSERAAEFGRYLEAERGWLDTYALFAALSEEHQHRPWWEWDEGLSRRQPQALAEAGQRLEREVRFRAWLQWVAESQWQKARESARRHQVLLCGDEPFIIGQDSADTWANPTVLRRDARLGAPPDDFSATGQDWGLPYFDFAAMERDDYAWLRLRAKKAASYYDLRRVDHAVGYFRQWIRDVKTPTGRFVPEDPAAHPKLGERHFRLLSQDAGIIAEDLGVIPPYVRQILTGLGLPGYRVLRWERDGQLFRNPHQFPALSVVTTGTHDTETLREWWERAPAPERAAVQKAYPELQSLPQVQSFTPEVHRALLAAAQNAGSDLCVLPWQDVLGTVERVNLPGSMSDANWSYRIAEDTSELLSVDRTAQAAQTLAELSGAARR
jgi:4-alpha-glucanotransferase